MEPERELNTDYADSILGALGLKSVSTERIADADQIVTDAMQTGILGTSFYSTKNRDALMQALQHEPRPSTLGDLREALEHLASTGGADWTTLLGAVRKACEQRPDARLDDLARDTSA